MNQWISIRKSIFPYKKKREWRNKKKKPKTTKFLAHTIN